MLEFRLLEQNAHFSCENYFVAVRIIFNNPFVFEIIKIQSCFVFCVKIFLRLLKKLDPTKNGNDAD